jgi:hypothetical protein
MQRHPGGDTVIALCSGQDVSDSLNAVGHLTNPSTRSRLENYRIGTLDRPKFNSSLAEELYMAAVDFGQKAAEMENVYRANFHLLDGKFTILDEPKILTPQKARHLLDAKNRLQDEHVPALAMLVNVLLDSIARLNTGFDLSIIYAQMLRLVEPESRLGTATRFSDYKMAVNTLRKDLSRLTKVKELVVLLLENLEGHYFAILEPSQIELIVNALSRAVSELMMLAGK